MSRTYNLFSILPGLSLMFALRELIFEVFDRFASALTLALDSIIQPAPVLVGTLGIVRTEASERYRPIGVHRKAMPAFGVGGEGDDDDDDDALDNGLDRVGLRRRN